jgi:hypothetical protein
MESLQELQKHPQMEIYNKVEEIKKLIESILDDEEALLD